MTFYTRILLIFLILMFLCSCSFKPTTIVPPEWSFEKQAIRLHLVGAPQLNVFQRTPHTLLLCVYHLRDPNAFYQLVDEKDGLIKLLECTRFDPSITFAKRIFIQPNQILDEAMDRAEGAKYVGIVAGFYSWQKENAVRFYNIPVVDEINGRTLVKKPAALEVNLQLGAQEIQQIEEPKKSK